MKEVQSSFHPPEIDLENGFPIIFRTIQYKKEYSVVVVPSTDSCIVRYSRYNPARMVLNLQPLDYQKWNVSGRFDAITFRRLGLEVNQIDTTEQGPVITDENIQAAKRWGGIEMIANEPSRIFQASLQLPSQMVREFLWILWQDSVKESPLSHIRIPFLRTGQVPGEDKVLPQLKAFGNSRGVRLVVLKCPDPTSKQ